jgi:hypothetical protein
MERTIARAQRGPFSRRRRAALAIMGGAYTPGKLSSADLGVLGPEEGRSFGISEHSPTR